MNTSDSLNLNLSDNNATISTVPTLSLIDGDALPIRSGYYRQLSRMTTSILRQLNRGNVPEITEYHLRTALFRNLNDMSFYRNKFYLPVVEHAQSLRNE